MLVPLALWFMLPSFIISSDILYIRTSHSPNSSCPDLPCLTLYQYTEQNNFTSDITLEFLPGNHSLHQAKLNLTNISNVTLKGEQKNLTSVNIICSTNIIIFDNVSDLMIEGLSFLLDYTQVNQGAALKLVNCDRVYISHTIFQGNGKLIAVRAIDMKHSNSMVINSTFKSTGGAILARDNTNLTISGSIFARNSGAREGGAINVMSSNLLLDGSNYFIHNSARYTAGVLECSRCRLEMKGLNKFHNNSALYARHYFAPSRGGALAVDNGDLLISGTVHFSCNKAFWGGAIFIQHSKTIFNGSIVFRENIATSEGGGMFIKSASVIAYEYLIFIGNTAETGGALHIDKDEDRQEEIIIVLSSKFINNSAYYHGGAVYAESVKMTFKNSEIRGNSGGSALHVSKCTITFNGTTEIKNNIGKAGGGIKADTTTIIFENNTLFSSNSNPSGDGGALNILQGKVSFHGNTVFIHNTANKDGGAIYAAGTSMETQGILNFTYNTAYDGGAMFLDTGASLTLLTELDSQAILITSSNFATQYGGGISVLPSTQSR